MSLRDKLREQAEPYLEPGEVIQAVLGAQTTSPYWALLSYWVIVFKDSYRAVVATDRRIIVFRTSRWRWTRFMAIQRTLPRTTRLGTPTGLNWKTESLGETLWIAKRFFKDVEAIDAGGA